MPRSFPQSFARRRLITGSGALLLSLVTACTSPARLSIASQLWPGYELMFLARDEGWLPDEIVLRETRSATESIDALRRGQIQGAALTLDEVLRVRGEGIPLEIVLVFDISAGADAVLTRRPLAAPSDLRGQRIGVEKTAVGALMLALLLERAGLTPSDVIQVPLTIDDHLLTWQAGHLDAIVSYEPTASLLRKAGAIRLLDSRDFPERIFDVLAVRTDITPGQQESLRRLIAAHFRALKQLQANPVDSAYRLAKRFGLAVDAVPESLRGLNFPGIPHNRLLLSADGSIARSAPAIVDILQRHGLIGSNDSLHGLVDASYLPPSEAS